MIRCRITALMAEKGLRDGQKITAEKVAAATGLSRGVMSRLTSSNFGRSESARVELDSIDRLCDYFGCGVGDILEHISHGVMEPE